ncbi:MAG TPA: hypothetical protein PKZ32_00800 [Candidatus Melainabacteria bacterium]|jgi:hypothetical protein|nr:hypothetical protein [Candidatus Melainabacteria bacterium]
MSFSFQRIFRLLLSQQPRADAVSFAEMPDETGENTSSAELSSSDETVQQKGETPFHIFEAPISGEGSLIFHLPQNHTEDDKDKRSRRHMQRQRSKARDLSRKAARQVKQLAFANAQH